VLAWADNDERARLGDACAEPDAPIAPASATSVDAIAAGLRTDMLFGNFPPSVSERVTTTMRGGSDVFVRSEERTQRVHAQV
jgi:hypothetical protein